MLYSYAFILDHRAKMKGFYNVLQLLFDCTGASYSLYYAEVKSEMYKLFTKYETKFGAARSQRVLQPSTHSGKKKQAWAKIFGDQAGSGVVGPPPTSSSSSGGAVSELTAYLDSDCVTAMVILT